MFIMIQHLCIISHVRELDEHLDVYQWNCLCLFLKNNINRLTSPNIKTTHCDVNVEIHLAFWKLMNINYESWFHLLVGYHFVVLKRLNQL